MSPATFLAVELNSAVLVVGGLSLVSFVRLLPAAWRWRRNRCFVYRARLHQAHKLVRKWGLAERVSPRTELRLARLAALEGRRSA